MSRVMLNTRDQGVWRIAAALLVALTAAVACAAPMTQAGQAASRGSNYRVPVFVQGKGVVLQSHPEWLLAKRNVAPPSYSGYDGIHVKHWRWGGAKSVGKGTYAWHTPNGSGLRVFPAQIKLVQARSCGGYRVYQRIKVHFRKKSPPHVKQTIGFGALDYNCRARAASLGRESCSEVVIRNSKVRCNSGASERKSICGGEYFTKATWRYTGKHGSTTSHLRSNGSGCYWTGA